MFRIYPFNLNTKELLDNVDTRLRVFPCLNLLKTDSYGNTDSCELLKTVGFVIMKHLILMENAQQQKIFLCLNWLYSC